MTTIRTLRFVGGLALLGLVASACGDDDGASVPTTIQATAPTTMAPATDAPSTTPAPAATDADIVDTAITAGDFTTLVAAVQAAGLEDTLRGDGPFTVFAPTDEAFAALPAGTVETLLEDPAGDLTDILTYHVVAGQLSPSDVAGEQTTVEGQKVDVTGSGNDLKVNDASVICGGVKTANATVYLIDGVLTPPKS